MSPLDGAFGWKDEMGGGVVGKLYYVLAKFAVLIFCFGNMDWGIKELWGTSKSWEHLTKKFHPLPCVGLEIFQRHLIHYS